MLDSSATRRTGQDTTCHPISTALFHHLGKDKIIYDETYQHHPIPSSNSHCWLLVSKQNKSFLLLLLLLPFSRGIINNKKKNKKKKKVQGLRNEFSQVALASGSIVDDVFYWLQSQLWQDHKDSTKTRRAGECRKTNKQLHLLWFFLFFPIFLQDQSLTIRILRGREESSSKMCVDCRERDGIWK